MVAKQPLPTGGRSRCPNTLGKHLDPTNVLHFWRNLSGTRSNPDSHLDADHPSPSFEKLVLVSLIGVVQVGIAIASTTLLDSLLNRLSSLKR